jgi:Uma2 family endonuclease
MEWLCFLTIGGYPHRMAVAMSDIAQLMTAAELFQTPGLGRCELVQGELIAMTPAGFEHGRIAAEISWILKQYVKSHPIGIVTGAETGFLIGRDPDTVRAPDAAFIRSDRLPATPVRGFLPETPDLVVEVLSPNDRASEVAAKVQGWLDAGCRMVWVVDPDNLTVTVYRHRDQVAILKSSDMLVGDDVLPDFTVRVGNIF